MFFLRQSTASTVVFGPFVSNADGVTAKTALTTQTGQLCKQGATGASFTPASWAHDWNGNYLVGVSTAHTDTVGRLRVEFYDATTYLPVWKDFTVLSAGVYDWLFGSTAPLTDKAGFSLSSPQSFNNAGQTTKLPATVATGDDADAASLKATIGVAGAGLTAIGDVRLANLDAQVSSRSVFNGGVVAGVTNPVTVGGYSAGQAPDTLVWGAGVRSLTDKAGFSLATAPPTLSQIVAGVWDELHSAHSTPGSFGAFLDAAISSVSTGGVSASDIATAVWASETRTLTAFAFTPSVTVSDKSGFSLTAAYDAAKAALPASSYVAPDNTTIGYLGGLLNAGHTAFTASALANAPTGSGGGGDATAANQTAIIDAIADLQAHGDSAWATANVSALALESTATAIKAKTDNLPAQPAAVGSTMAVSDKTGFKLASDGLDSIATTEPTGPMSGYNFRQLLRWLVMRFNNASKTPTSLAVKTSAGATATTQALADDGNGTESTGVAS